MSIPKPVRYLLVVFLVLISIIPQLLTIGILGEINLWFLVLLWLLLSFCYFYAGPKLSRIATFIASLAMAVPPAPNYLFPSGPDDWRLTWIGWNNLLEAGSIYGIVFFFIFHAMTFATAGWLIRYRKTVSMQSETSS